ncbi:MAG: hypothetical protein ACREEM_47310 [Blastocatellia bacterium]
MNSFDSFTLSPMSAGDIIDRAVRLYKRNFFVLLRIVLAPSLVAYAGAIILSIGWRNFTLMRGDSRVALTTMMVIGGGLLWLVGEAAFYAVLGGSSRALVAHLSEGKPIRAREVYASVRQRIWSLVGATLMIGLIIVAVFWLVFMVIAILVMMVTAIAGKLVIAAPGWVQTLFGILYVVITVGLVLISFLLVYSRLVYVPQILMVERKGVFSAISRSFQLAGGELVRIGAVVIFWIYVAWSVWVMMAVPVEWYAYSVGVDITPFNPDVPIWYQIAKQTLTQLSEILIWPIAMLCFTLLYLNSRVRKEGYDIEVLANRVLEAPPAPQHRVMVAQPAPAPVSPVPSILGLSDYRPVEQAVTAAETDRAPATVAAIFDQSEGVPSSGFQSAENGDVVTDPSPAARATVGVAGKSCSWCGTDATVQDRFCRVCGSVF